MAANTMQTLHRAVAQIGDQPEVHVFFLVPAGADAGIELLTVINGVCKAGTERIEAWNVLSEPELLRDWAMGEESTGDARLFERGFDRDQVTYLDPGRALYLVDAATSARLHRAARRVPTTAQLAA